MQEGRLELFASIPAASALRMLVVLRPKSYILADANCVVLQMAAAMLLPAIASTLYNQLNLTNDYKQR